MNKKAICENCKFFKKIDKDDLYNEDRKDGECRLNSPIIYKGDTVFPEVNNNDWCGKFQDKNKRQ